MMEKVVHKHTGFYPGKNMGDLHFDLSEFWSEELTTLPLGRTYEVCLKNNRTVHTARKTFIAEKKAKKSIL